MHCQAVKAYLRITVINGHLKLAEGPEIARRGRVREAALTQSARARGCESVGRAMGRRDASHTLSGYFACRFPFPGMLATERVSLREFATLPSLFGAVSCRPRSFVGVCALIDSFGCVVLTRPVMRSSSKKYSSTAASLQVVHAKNSESRNPETATGSTQR